MCAVRAVSPAQVTRIVAQGHIEPRSNAGRVPPPGTLPRGHPPRIRLVGRVPPPGTLPRRHPPRIKSGAPKIYKPGPLGGGRGDGRSLGRIGLCPQSSVRRFGNGYLLLHGNTLTSTARCWRNRVPALRIAELSSCGRPKYPSFRKLMTRVLGPASAGPFFRNQAPRPELFSVRKGRASLPRVIQSKTDMARPRPRKGGAFSRPQPDRNVVPSLNVPHQYLGRHRYSSRALRRYSVSDARKTAFAYLC